MPLFDKLFILFQAHHSRTLAPEYGVLVVHYGQPPDCLLVFLYRQKKNKLVARAFFVNYKIHVFFFLFSFQTRVPEDWRSFQNACTSIQYGSKRKYGNAYFVFLVSYEPCSGVTHYLTMSHFEALKIYGCGKHCEKGEIACSKQFLLSHNVFYTLWYLFFILNALFNVVWNLFQIGPV